jgi:hypothetical protein
LCDSYAIVIDDEKPENIYVGTDIGVFSTTNSGQSWTKFSEGLPNCAINDMYIHSKARLLRAATHGRGMWERKIDVQAMHDVNIFLRHNLMDTGRFALLSDVPPAFNEPLQNITLNGKLLSWSMCADIKVDPPFYKFDEVDEVDYVKFETELQHRNLQRGRINHIYVQLHNRGIKAADKVTVKLMYANIGENGSSYPMLPSDFWAGFLDDSYDTSNWKPIGEIKNIPEGLKTLTNVEPTVVGWKWSTPLDLPDHICLLVVVDSTEDPIPESSKKIVNIEELVRKEKRVGARVVDVVSV